MIQCQECGRTGPATRVLARREGWEPYRTRTQHDLDQGPMVCPECVGALLEACIDALRAHARKAG